MKFLRHAQLGLTGALALVASCTTPPSEDDFSTAKSNVEAPAVAFDFDHGNIATELIIPTIVQQSLSYSASGGDASVILYTTTMVTNGWFDAIAPYRPGVKGVQSNLPKRPSAERTNRNKNIAMAYAALRTLSATMPKKSIAAWRSMLQSVGLNPDDNSTDTGTAVGIGNVAGNSVIAARRDDGMNVFGDAGGRKYNRRPYDDTTGFAPIQTAYNLTDPSSWQPLIKTGGYGLFTVQQFVTPQWARTRPYTLDPADPQWRVPPPVASDYQNHRAAYIAQIDDVLAHSANLDDRKKMNAELFNNKFIALGFSSLFLTQSRGLNVDQFVDLDFMFQVAAFDAGIVTWKEKARYNAVRPYTAARVVYGNHTVRAWGGPGKGTVNDIPANEWEPYLSTADHPEYPSGSACFCSAHAQAGRRYFGSDDFGWPFTFPMGSSSIEPGITPAADLTLFYPTWTNWVDECKQARVDAGVHFQAAVDASATMCQPAGDLAYDFLQRHLHGHN